VREVVGDPLSVAAGVAVSPMQHDAWAVLAPLVIGVTVLGERVAGI
jgi:hypothetical protein